MSTSIPIDAFGPFLLGLRLGAGVSQREVARRAGMSPDTVRRLERGDTSTRADKLIRYGNALGVGLTYQFRARDDGR